MTSDASRELEKQHRKFFRQNIHRIWNMVKSGRRDELSEKDNHLAEILIEHEEYSDHFENNDILTVVNMKPVRHSILFCISVHTRW